MTDSWSVPLSVRIASKNESKSHKTHGYEEPKNLALAEFENLLVAEETKVTEKGLYDKHSDVSNSKTIKNMLDAIQEFEEKDNSDLNKGDTVKKEEFTKLSEPIVTQFGSNFPTIKEMQHKHMYDQVKQGINAESYGQCEMVDGVPVKAAPLYVDPCLELASGMKYSHYFVDFSSFPTHFNSPNEALHTYNGLGLNKKIHFKKYNVTRDHNDFCLNFSL